MSKALTADGLVTRVKARGMIPSNDPRLTDADILAIADDILINDVGLSVYDADDGRWIRTAPDVPLAVDRSEYRLPDRAFAGGIDDVLLVDTAGDEIPLDYVNRKEIWQWSGTGSWANAARNPAPRYTILGDVIKLLPAPTDVIYKLRVRYVRRPSELALVADSMLLTAADGTTLTGVFPVSWGAAATIDVIEGSSGADSLYDDVSVTLSGTTATAVGTTFGTSGAYVPAAGDYASLAGTSPIVQVPDVALPYLVERTTAEVVSAIGDVQAAAARMSIAEQRRVMMDNALASRNRVKERVIAYNSPLRSVGMGRRRGRWGR